MPSSAFEGYPGYVEQAAKELRSSVSPGDVRTIGPLTSVANLCSQASEPTADRFEEILAKAEEFHDRLQVARLAAELMIADVRARRGGTPAPAARRGRQR